MGEGEVTAWTTDEGDDPARIGIAGEMTREQKEAARRAFEALPMLALIPDEYAETPEGLVRALSMLTHMANGLVEGKAVAERNLHELENALRVVAKAAKII